MGMKLENFEAAAELEAKADWGGLLAFTARWTADEPTNVFAWQARAIALRKSGRPDEAVPTFRKAIELAPPTPREFFGRMLSSGPLWYGLAHTYSDSGRYAEAIEAFMEAARVDPTAVAVWNDLGAAYANSNDYKGAFEALKTAVSLDPSNSNSLRNLGVIYAVCGVKEGVEHIHKRLLSLDARLAAEFLQKANSVRAGR